MTCAELKELAGAMAVGALEPSERAACEAHLKLPIAHEGCAEAARAAGEAAALLAVALPAVTPGDGVWGAIESRIGATPARSRARTVERRWFGGWIFAAAATAAVAFLWFVDHGRLEAAAGQREAELSAIRGRVENGARACQQELASVRGDLKARDEALAMLQQPTTAVVALAPQGGVPMHASVLYDRASHHAMVVATGLSPHPGKDCELWVIRGDKKMPAGLLRGDAAGGMVTHVDQKLFADGNPDAFAVTLEPAGGGPTPRGPIMLVGTLSKG